MNYVILSLLFFANAVQCMQPQYPASMDALIESEYGAHFLQLTPATVYNREIPPIVARLESDLNMPFVPKWQNYKKDLSTLNQILSNPRYKNTMFYQRALACRAFMLNSSDFTKKPDYRTVYNDVTAFEETLKEPIDLPLQTMAKMVRADLYKNGRIATLSYTTAITIYNDVINNRAYTRWIEFLMRTQAQMALADIDFKSINYSLPYNHAINTIQNRITSVIAQAKLYPHSIAYQRLNKEAQALLACTTIAVNDAVDQPDIQTTKEAALHLMHIISQQVLYPGSLSAQALNQAHYYAAVACTPHLSGYELSHAIACAQSYTHKVLINYAAAKDTVDLLTLNKTRMLEANLNKLKGEKERAITLLYEIIATDKSSLPEPLRKIIQNARQFLTKLLQ